MKNTRLSMLLMGLVVVFSLGYLAVQSANTSTSIASTPNIPQPLLDLTRTQSALDQTATSLAPYPTLEATATVYGSECAGSGVRCKGQEIRDLKATEERLQQQATSLIATLTAEAQNTALTVSPDSPSSAAQSDTDTGGPERDSN